MRCLSVIIVLLLTPCPIKSQSIKEMNIRYVNVKNEKIKASFRKVVEQYEPLHDLEITLIQKRIKSSTMQAQPILTWSGLSGKINQYQVKLGTYVRDSKTIEVADLPADVLTGWFAHELGHIVDYKPYTSWQMIGYGVRYLFSPRFRRQAEHAADYIAIASGFKKEIIAAKRYILESDFLENAYKAKIKKYYLSIEDVKLCKEDEMILMPVSGL